MLTMKTITLHDLREYLGATPHGITFVWPTRPTVLLLGLVILR